LSPTNRGVNASLLRLLCSVVSITDSRLVLGITGSLESLRDAFVSLMGIVNDLRLFIIIFYLMKLDLSAFRYLTTEDFRVLTAIEMGMRNHEIVPVSLIESIAKLKKANTFKVIQNLLKHKLVEHSNLKYDGYSLNFIGYDYLAIHTMMKRGILMKIGAKLGVGKESDVFICYVNPSKSETELTEDALAKLRLDMVIDEEDNCPEDEDEEYPKEEGKEEIVDTSGKPKVEKVELEEPEDDQNVNMNELNTRFDNELVVNGITCHIAVIKLARLGRTSFRAVKTKRDYVKNKTHYNWLYLSRLSAINEFKFLNGLYNAGFIVPKPHDHNRHAIVMEYIPSIPLCRIDDLVNKEKAYNELISTLIKMAERGLIHGDFNEFNILVTKEQKLYVIDFPQMLSLEHGEAREYFDRDLKCINKFFMKKFGIKFESSVEFNDIHRVDYLDVKLKAYGYDVVLARLKQEEKEELKQLQVEIEEGSSIEDDDAGDLEFNEEDVQINAEESTVKKEIDIKSKVKRMLQKEHSNTGSKSKSNRFKTKGKGKVDL
jgi:RIO-like serine/threonine protein kinase